MLGVVPISHMLPTVKEKLFCSKQLNNCQQLAPELVDKDKTANEVGETRPEYIPN